MTFLVVFFRGGTVEHFSLMFMVFEQRIAKCYWLQVFRDPHCSTSTCGGKKWRCVAILQFLASSLLANAHE
jgi:hypothetical protein